MGKDVSQTKKAVRHFAVVYCCMKAKISEMRSVQDVGNEQTSRTAAPLYSVWADMADNIYTA